MKKITYFVLFFIGIVTNGFGQLSEDFESGTFPPAGWTIETSVPGFTWMEEPAGINGTSALVNWNDVDFQDESLVSPVFTVPADASLYFNLVMGYEYGVDPNDNYDFTVSISTDGGTTWTPLWTEADWGVFVDYETLNVVVDLATYGGSTNAKLKFNYAGFDGDVLALDDIVVSATVEVPSCASNYMPMDGATDVPGIGDVILSWDAPTTGGAVASYNIYGGIDSMALDLLGNTTDLFFNAGSAEAYNFTYYWQVVPVNTGGDAIGCAVNSFTTVASPGFCLNAQFGQWPNATYTPEACDGTTVNEIVANGYAGEYSLVNVEAGVSYTFGSSVATDYITISSDDGATAAAHSVTPLTWVADVTGEVRFYTHLDDQCGAEDVDRARTIVCSSSVAIPGCASNPSPADMSTDVAVGPITLTWDVPTTGGSATSYDLYTGDTETTLALLGNYTTNTTGTDLNINAYGATVYWQIVPKNISGSATGCDVWSFTTQSSPGFCLGADNFGQWPAATYSTQVCDGLTDNVIATNCYAGEYSVVTVVSGETYTFRSSVATDFITISTDDGVTAATFGVTPLTWVSDVDGDIRFYTHLDDQCGEEDVDRTRSFTCGTPATDSPDYVSLQWPPTSTVVQGTATTVYGQVYEAGLTDVTTGQAPGINAWVGVSTTNTNPNTWTNWTAATYDSEQGNNDQYLLNIGAALAPGTYYYATRFNLNGGAYVYGGINQAAPNNGNFWDGATFGNGILTITPPPAPANDECTGAIALTPGGVFATNPVDGTILGAATTAGIIPTCQTLFGFDVWYSVVVPASGTLTIETQTATANSMTDSVVAAFTGTCGSLTQIGCDDDGGPVGANNLMSILSLTGLNAGETIYVGVWKFDTPASTGANSAFRISAYDASLSNESFDNTSFTYYPNPVKNVLNLSYNQNISQVEVYNLLGQKMTSNSFDATTAQVDMSSYTSGVYLVKVTSNNTTKTVRVIKE